MITFNGIINEVAECYGVDADDLLYGDRRQPACEARHVAMYLCHIILGMELKVISAHFGQNRTIANYAVKKVSAWVAQPRFNRDAAKCVETFTNKSKGNDHGHHS